MNDAGLLVLGKVRSKADKAMNLKTIIRGFIWCCPNLSFLSTGDKVMHAERQTYQ